MPYEVVFSLTRYNSDTPLSASHFASSMISSGLREMNEPRKYGIAQNEQRRSQPLAILSGAIGALSRRLRSTLPIGFTSTNLRSSRT